MKFTTRYALALVGAMGLIAAAESAQAIDLNGKGSSAGRNFAGQTTGAVCDPGQPATYYYSANATNDPTLPATRSEWRCTVPGAAGTTVFRYHGTASLDGYTSLNNTSLLLNTQGYFNTQAPAPGACTQIAAPNPRAFGGHPSVTIFSCSSNTALLTNLPIHYGASDVQGSSFTQSAFGASVVPPVLAAGVDLTTLPINTVPFGVAVGGGVRQGAGPGLLDNLSISDLQQILSGTVTNWTRIGNTTDTAGQTNITVCHRTVGSGTLATLDQTIMKKGPAAINPTRVPAAGAPALGAVGNLNNASSGDIVNCMNNTGGVNPNNRMSIGYIDSDSLGLIAASGAHFVKINGFQVFDGTLPATSARLKDLRCGDYPYWANWNMIVRTNGVDGVGISGGGTVPTGTQNVLDSYIGAAISNNPLPGFWATQADMFVIKNDDQGPHANIPGGETFCQKAN
jgi:ABC-type phosphate transport system substrate-binding protein